jgi:hypothetical protein
MSRLLLPFALLISHFSLINHTAAAHTIDRLINTTSSLRSVKTIAGSFSDSSPVRYTISSGYHTVQIIIPTKTVCRQRINTFFIVAIPDALLGKYTAQAEEPVIFNKTTDATNMLVNNIGGGSDELELLLKTPGRIINNPGLNSFTSIAAITTYLSRWATSFLYH